MEFDADKCIINLGNSTRKSRMEYKAGGTPIKAPEKTKIILK